MIAAGWVAFCIFGYITYLLLYLYGMKTMYHFFTSMITLGILFSLLTLWLFALFQKNLLHLAQYDSLTDLPNRFLFNEILTKLLSHAKRHQKILAVLYIDLDNFKSINDIAGHSAGDLVLKKIAEKFSKSLRSGDTLARVGGDEFVILLNEIPHARFASIVAEKLLHICTQPLQLKSHEFFLFASIGISIYPSDGTSIENLLVHSDKAMYKAKKAGGNRFQYYTQQIDSEIHEHMDLESALHNAINNNEFVLHYQPKLDLRTNKIMGVEALVRWESPTLGLISPDKFIPLAEETGLILQIDYWVLREACRVNKAWQEQGYEPITIAVNFSAKQFCHQNIAKIIVSALTETNLDPRYLELEITETAVMENVEITIEKLNDINKIGVNIAVDDFGTGYISISQLKQFPVSVLKIDGSFIEGIPHNQDDISITIALISLAHNLNIKVVAEGVETPEQLAFLRTHDCDMIQGFYLSRPLPASEVVLQFTKIG